MYVRQILYSIFLFGHPNRYHYKKNSIQSKGFDAMLMQKTGQNYAVIPGFF